MVRKDRKLLGASGQFRDRRCHAYYRPRLKAHSYGRQRDLCHVETETHGRSRQVKMEAKMDGISSQELVTSEQKPDALMAIVSELAKAGNIEAVKEMVKLRNDEIARVAK